MFFNWKYTSGWQDHGHCSQHNKETCRVFRNVFFFDHFMKDSRRSHTRSAHMLCSWARTLARQFRCLLGNLKIHTIISPWKMIKPKKTKTIILFPDIQDSKTVFIIWNQTINFLHLGHQFLLCKYLKITDKSPLPQTILKNCNFCPISYLKTVLKSWIAWITVILFVFPALVFSMVKLTLEI